MEGPRLVCGRREAGGQSAITPRVSAVADEVSGEFSSTSLRSTIRRDGSAYSLPPLGGWGPPKGTAVEYAGATKAPSLALQWRARIFAGYAHSVDSNAPGEWCVE